ncbi:MAG: Smr/MutS family protein, partial [Bryobacteraceae bacterium]
ALKELLGRYVSSPLGRAELDKVAPLSDRKQIESALAELTEAIEYLRASAQPQPATRGAAIRIRFDGLPDVAGALSRLRIEGASLEALEILRFTDLLERAADVRSILTGVAARFPLLAAHGGAMSDLRSVVRELAGKILPGGSLADGASVALARLRRDMERQQKQIQNSLERFLRVHHGDGTLQEDFITIRNDRFVVPLVAGQQRKVDGVIHGASSSGHTLFVEPLETIDLNNGLVRLAEEEAREVHRILLEMTSRLREHAVEIACAVRVLAQLELLFGKAAYALDFDCVAPRFSPETNRRLVLREARHPLLAAILRRQNKPIVPISFALDRERRTLLISGPNTGGKTVALKTAGLLALMAHAALPVPAVEAEFPLFDLVLADIGDNQSIQESLSTFSAHIWTVREMLESATPDSLVLLDELGRATDPDEGGALGVAILDSFRGHGAFTLASTHLVALKIYGAGTPGVLNASMGFDEETLQPTYALRVGSPGKSAGLDIAARLGLPAPLIEQARAAMSSRDRDIARFLNELQHRLEETGRTEEELKQRADALAAREQALEKEWQRKGEAKVREIEKLSEAAIARFEEDSRRALEELPAKTAGKAQRKVSQTRREFREQIDTATGRTAAGGPTAIPAKLEEGARVRLKGIRQPARFRRTLSDGSIEVEAGFLKMQVSIDDIEEVLPPAPAAASLPRGISYQQGPRWDVSYREINLIGRHAGEACEEVDKFLDSAALAQVDRIRIVHGHGMGILRKAISELLAQSPHVEKFYPATPAEGGNGATIVELKAAS